MYIEEDRTFCFERCANMKCDRNSKHIRQLWLPHSYAMFHGTDYCAGYKVDAYDKE